ncbi:sialate O-acetylesterase [Psychrosphaera sp. B3R10]|uniref:sialate O-acetylesterase n=1 Tax=unclassified Psychrosphaera TaxID=2641570 RepID=UPI001C0A1E2F|nr:MULTISPECIES: sialate O-acetylesterase [unclassified Psychrosphaera]MBU2883923.1 sialate O-acetylesterase [Psychrosphaera sp. I2R16]MBU2990118.1 sialate O-acetylesterase [Psychrosphaera sp. B3R10]
MNKIHFLLFALSLLSLPNMAQTYDIFIVAGQSNAQGWKGDAAQYPIDVDGLDPNIPMFYIFPEKQKVNSSNGKWITLGPQGGRFEKGHFGPEISFARQLKTKGYQPAIFKFSKGATSLAKSWKRPGENGLTDKMIASYHKAMKALKEDGHTGVVRGFIWIQGESDSHGKSAVAYSKNLSALIKYVRNDLTNVPNLPVILGIDEQHKFVKKTPLVLESHKSFAAKDPNAIFTSMLGLEKADKTHLTPTALIAHGERLSQAYLTLVGDK